jgi:hypothetical protein
VDALAILRCSELLATVLINTVRQDILVSKQAKLGNSTRLHPKTFIVMHNKVVNVGKNPTERIGIFAVDNLPKLLTLVYKDFIIVTQTTTRSKVMNDILEFLEELKSLRHLYSTGDLREFDFDNLIKNYEAQVARFERSMEEQEKLFWENTPFYSPAREV